MLIRHSVIYFFSRALPGAVNLAALVIYTRLLSPGEYGEYALVIYGVGLVNTLLYWWLRLGLIRFAPRYASVADLAAFMATLLRGFTITSGISAVLTIMAVLIVGDTHLQLIILFSALLLWAQAWFELNLELIRSRLSPIYFGVLSLIRAALALFIGGALVWAGFSVWGLLIGVFVSMLLPGLWEVLKSWRKVSFHYVDRALLHQFFSYGLPLVGVFGLEYVISSSDRFMLAWLVGTAATGTYSAAYDLTNQSLIMLMSAVYLAGYPLIVKTLESEGEQAARLLLANHLTVLLVIGLPAAVLVSALATGISGTFLGTHFQQGAVEIIPWVALGTLFAGIKGFYFDIAFQLANRTSRQILVVAMPAVLNILLNLWWIPRMGMVGAALATFVAYLCALFLSWYLGKREFVMPVLSLDIMKVFLAVGVMILVAMVLVAQYSQSGMRNWGSIAGILLGVYSIIVLVLNVCGVRAWLAARLRTKAMRL